MRAVSPRIGNGVVIAFAAILIATAIAAVGCSSMKGNGGAVSPNPIPTVKTAVPVSITDAPGDQVIAASLTLNSIVLTDTTGATASILTAPLTFEATHLDAVQEPLFTPAIPEDTYVSATLTYSNPQVAYVDPTTKKVVQATPTLANSTQTITFPMSIAIANSSTSLLIDYLVANSVTISGTTVTVAPDFHIAAVPIPPQPTNGTNGLQCGIKGQVTALGANSFTLTNAQGTALTIAVNGITQYQGLSGFSALAVGALVEVDTITLSDGSLLAARVEEQIQASAASQLLVGPVTAATGSPATSFTMLVRQAIGGATVAAPTEVTIAVTAATQFVLPGRFDNVKAEDPIGGSFTASTLFAGQVVAVATTGVSNDAATAAIVALSPQTVDGTITSIIPPLSQHVPNWTQTVLALPSGNWLATLTGQTTVTVLTPIGVPDPAAPFQQIDNTPPAVGDMARFNGFLFDNGGTLTLVALVQADGPGVPIGPPTQ